MNPEQSTYSLRLKTLGQIYNILKFTVKLEYIYIILTSEGQMLCIFTLCRDSNLHITSCCTVQYVIFQINIEILQE